MPPGSLFSPPLRTLNDVKQEQFRGPRATIVHRGRSGVHRQDTPPSDVLRRQPTVLTNLPHDNTHQGTSIQPAIQGAAKAPTTMTLPLRKTSATSQDPVADQRDRGPRQPGVQGCGSPGSYLSRKIRQTRVCKIPDWEPCSYTSTLLQSRGENHRTGVWDTQTRQPEESSHKGACAGYTGLGTR
ncbi:hypothetical protein THAOC_36355 [Thalassiosira oceanica]|uniref:Uncharacterized protein n=1 Tax=Thalassiosira oceanica TaxID=159749 RepID=K0R0B4_THAOC|nr:hypothetical protein THAOC_36355 [Thalassiosira oceanica]|eukprot:EJK45055.1 hypothetical protein THAOC_36355 [Thalassiosira oceanica]